MATNFVEKVYAFTRQNRLFSAPCHVLVAVSGGADSLALLQALIDWPEVGLTISAVHVNHGIRGASADRDEECVRNYCALHRIPLQVYREDVVGYASAHGLSLEEAGRRIRYTRFEQCREGLSADFILTAHTSSDQAETVLMRIIRGSGMDGLTGIPVKRDAICRPLLGCSREEIEQYCKELDLPFVTDETNTDLRYTRNRIRHQVMPLLEQLNPAVEASLNKLVHYANEDADYFRDVCDPLLPLDGTSIEIEKLLNQHPAIRHRLIRRLLVQAKLPTFEDKHIYGIEQLVHSGHGKLLLPNGYFASVSTGTLFILSDDGYESISEVAVNSLPSEIEIGEEVYSIRILSEEETKNVHSLFSNCCVDYDRIQGNLFIRSRREGDTIRLAGHGITKSLKKLMNEWRIPNHLRDTVPLLCDEEGILLIPGYACAERAATDANTKHFLVWNGPNSQG